MKPLTTAFLLAASCFLQSPAYSFPSAEELCNNYYPDDNNRTIYQQILTEVSEVKLVSCELLRTNKHLETTNRLLGIVLAISTIIAFGSTATFLYATIKGTTKKGEVRDEEKKLL